MASNEPKRSKDPSYLSAEFYSTLPALPPDMSVEYFLSCKPPHEGRYAPPMPQQPVDQAVHDQIYESRLDWGLDTNS